MKTVYLAGPITGLTFTGGAEWRDQMIQDLAQIGVKGLSPLRAKEYLLDAGPLSAAGYAARPLSSSRGIMTRDRFDCTRCDVLLVNLLGAERVSIGTCMEIAWADAVRTPIVVAMEPHDNLHDHAMIQEAIGFRVPTLAEAFHVVRAILA